jgi:hypothetical protein
MTDFAENWSRFREWWNKADKVARYKLFRNAFGARMAYELLDILEIEAWEVACWFTTQELYKIFEALPGQEGPTGFRQEGRLSFYFVTPLKYPIPSETKKRVASAPYSE